MNKTEKQKMLAGELYNASDSELVTGRKNASRLTRSYNATSEQEKEQRTQILSELFGAMGQNINIEPPFYCDYGSNIYLDCTSVHIGEKVLCGPSVHIYTASHPTDPEVRRSGLELAAPVKIGNNVWIGGGAIVCPGVTIGDDTTIGAGSVVVKDIPARVVAAGNPCRVINHL
jgi:maltose O-acetyltransferase